MDVQSPAEGVRTIYLSLQKGIDRPVTTVVTMAAQGVETDANEPLSLIPTPTGVARHPKDEVFFHRGQT